MDEILRWLAQVVLGATLVVQCVCRLAKLGPGARPLLALGGVMIATGGAAAVLSPWVWHRIVGWAAIGLMLGQVLMFASTAEDWSRGMPDFARSRTGRGISPAALLALVVAAATLGAWLQASL
jgi:hypothetical protein